MKIIPIDIADLGNRTYLIHDGNLGVIVDPSRRFNELIDLAEKEKIEIAAVAETHIHNDYITGGYALAREVHAKYFVSADEKIKFKADLIEHGQKVQIGDLTIEAISSPGHTHHHLSYLISDKGKQQSLFSGGSLLYGSVGRTDLVSANDTKQLTHDQFKTARYFVDHLDPETFIYPTHGFGSFCAATDTDKVAVSTLKEQLKTNDVYLAKDEDTFVQNLVDSLDDFPAYYVYMAPANLKGPDAAKLDVPKKLTAEQVKNAMHTGAAIIDMRNRVAYAKEHLKGTYNMEPGSSFATYAGWVFQWDMPLILIAENEKIITRAVEQLSLIGREIEAESLDIKHLLKSGPTGSYEIKKFKDYFDKSDKSDIVLLDVRRLKESKSKQVRGALNIPLHKLEENYSKLDKAKDIWVFCASGYRASLAASMLTRAGFKATLIDDVSADYAKPNSSTNGTELIKLIKSKKAVLVDVRDDIEWDEGHAEYAKHWPLDRLLSGDIDEKLDTPPQLVLVYCRSGNRSGIAEKLLNQRGLETINVGGLNDWLSSGGSLAK
jgi:hydroxyacylglutathione hydrolase